MVVQRTRLLIVDDDADTITTSALLLTKLGHMVLAVGSGEAALEAIQDFKPDVVLLDIAMPDMDGYELARRIRQLIDFKYVVIVAITGYGQPSDREKSKDAGIDHHLVKPITLDDLKAILAEWEARTRVD
jgi:two-component system CheB/CheR fusion protein